MCALSHFSHVRLFVTSWTDYNPTGSAVMGFPRQEYWNGLPFPSPGSLPNPGIKVTFSAWHADSLPLSPLESPMFILDVLFS